MSHPRLTHDAFQREESGRGWPTLVQVLGLRDVWEHGKVVGPQVSQVGKHGLVFLAGRLHHVHDSESFLLTAR